MSSSQELYTRLIGTLNALVSVTHIAELKNWVWIVVGILQSNSVALSQIATHIPGETQAESRVTTIRRWLKNLARFTRPYPKAGNTFTNWLADWRRSQTNRPDEVRLNDTVESARRAG
jgi:hypothetical protein